MKPWLSLPSDILMHLGRHLRTPHAIDLHYPLNPMPRIAVLGLDGPHCRGVLARREWTEQDLQKFRPQALAGWWNDLAEVARQWLNGRLELPSLDSPLLVFVRPEAAPLPERCHDLLWEWFRLPVFEQIRTPAGRLLAYECEARDGFHIACPEAAHAIPLSEPLWRPCPCGSAAPLYGPRQLAALRGVG